MADRPAFVVPAGPVAVPPASGVTLEWLDHRLTQTPLLMPAFAMARSRGFAPHDLVLVATFDESSGQPPRFAVMDHPSAAKLVAPLLVPRYFPAGTRGLSRAFEQPFLDRLAEAARLRETLAISVFVHANGGVETYTAEGVFPSEHKGQA
jgi:hypothetical protein